MYTSFNIRLECYGIEAAGILVEIFNKFNS